MNHPVSAKTIIELDIASLYMQEGIIHIVYKNDVIVDADNVKEVIHQRIAMAEGKPRPILVDARLVKYWTRESKEYSHSKEAIKDMAAVAVVNKSVVAKIHINFVLKFYRPPFPLKFFNDIENALKWLEEFKS